MINAQMMPSMLPMHGGGPIKFVASDYIKTSDSTGTASIPVPVGTVPGDLLVMINTSSSTAFNNDVSGLLTHEEDFTSGGVPITRLFTRTYQAGDASSFGALLTGAGQKSFIMLTFRNASELGATSDIRSASGGSSSLTIPGITASAGSTLIAHAVSSNLVTNTGPDGMIQEINDFTNPPISVFYEENLPAGPTGDKTFTYASTTGNRRGLLFEVLP